MLAITEIRRRKLQFGLVTGVVTLIAYLVIMVTHDDRKSARADEEIAMRDGRLE